MEGDEMKEDAGRRTKEREEDRGRHDDRRKKRERNDQRDRMGAGDRQMKDRGDQEENRGDRRTETDEHEGGQGRKKQRRGHRGGGGTGSREPSALGNRDLNGKFDNFSSTNRKKTRVDEKEKERQSCTIFVGDLDPMVTAEQLTSLFQKFGTVLSAKIKDNHCYGFVTFDKRDCAEAAIGAGQKEDGIPLLNNKQVYVSWALGSLPDWKKGIGGFTVSPGKQQNRPRSRKGVVKPSVLAAATAAAAAKAYAVLAGADLPSPSQDTGAFRGREIVAYDDLL